MSDGCVAHNSMVNDLRRVLMLLGVATSIVVATEFIVAGLLPVMARDLGVTIADAGRLTGAFALSAALCGPLLTLAAASQPRAASCSEHCSWSPRAIPLLNEYR